jgi:hypothetical protein
MKTQALPHRKLSTTACCMRNARRGTLSDETRPDNAATMSVGGEMQEDIIPLKYGDLCKESEMSLE